LLGTGKTDYVGATALAKELAAAPAAQAWPASEEGEAEPASLQQHVA
jgi:acyl-[acyl-carrier-protein]-phospholipid O-acyltransferase / long-chain-fatty-acid--[acyl-carrier-protein] ligase